MNHAWGQHSAATFNGADPTVPSGAPEVDLESVDQTLVAKCAIAISNGAPRGAL